MLAPTLEAPITLIGRLSRFMPRARQNQAAPVWMAWVQVPRVGRIGVYVRSSTDTLAVHLLSQRWVAVQGTVAPLRVQALADDPRCADAPDAAPLLIHAHTLAPAQATAAGSTIPVQTLPILRGRPIAAGYLARARYLPDVYALTATPSGGVVQWNFLAVALTQIGRQRYMRYIVTLDPTRMAPASSS